MNSKKRGCWPHPVLVSRRERKLRAETQILRTPEAFSGETTRTVRSAVKAQRAPGFIARLGSRIAAILGRTGRQLFCHSF